MSMYVIIVINLLTGIFLSSNWFSLDHSLNFSLDHSQKNDQENDQFWSFMRITCSSWWKTCSTWWKICVAPKCSIRTCSNSYMFKFVHTKNVLNRYLSTSMFKYVDQAHVTFPKRSCWWNSCWRNACWRNPCW